MKHNSARESQVKGKSRGHGNRPEHANTKRVNSKHLENETQEHFLTKNQESWIKIEKELLHQRDITSIQQLPVIVEIARKGVKTEVFYLFANAIGFSDKELASLINLTSRTLINYKEKGKALDAPQGEHLLKLISLYKKGEDILGSLTALSRWLSKPGWKFKQPYIEWLVTPGGVDLVSLELDRLAEGYSL